MIKLIASDLDGTLLLPDGTLPEETFSVIQALHAQGILFTVASGRQYESIKRLFAPVADKILFIAENGALVFYREQRLFNESLPPDCLYKALAAVRTQPQVYPLLCCAEYAYTQDNSPAFTAECAKYYPNLRYIENLEYTPELDSVCKIAVFDERGAAANSGKLLPALLPSLRVVVSGNVWSDISMPETNKGKALTFVQRYFNLKKEECMAFGDYMNDLELLLACGEAYVPENGFPLLKERIGRIMPSNMEKGVIKKIKEVLQKQS